MLPRTFTGVSVTSDSAFRIGAVYACVRLLSDSISCLPADTFYRNAGERLPFRPKPAWVDNPDIGTSREDHFQQVMVSLLIDGNSYTRIFRNPDGSIAALAVLNPSHMKVRRNYENGDIEYLHDDRTVISYKEMLHITELRRPGALKGISRIGVSIGRVQRAILRPGFGHFRDHRNAGELDCRAGDGIESGI
jgi:HK97 family phage portal protein